MIQKENDMFNYVERHRGRKVEVLFPSTLKGTIGIIHSFECSMTDSFIRLSLPNGCYIIVGDKKNIKLLPKKC